MSFATKALKRKIEDLLAQEPDDLRLRERLEPLRKEPGLSGLTWFWGPELYRRNRVIFREFILAHFSEFELISRLRWQRVGWQEHAERLAGWLALARRHRDVWMTRRLQRWKFAGERWSLDHDAWCRELSREYQAAQGPAAQAIVLDEFDVAGQLDEPAACAPLRRQSGMLEVRAATPAVPVWFFRNGEAGNVAATIRKPPARPATTSWRMRFIAARSI